MSATGAAGPARSDGAEGRGQRPHSGPITDGKGDEATVAASVGVMDEPDAGAVDALFTVAVPDR